MNYGVDESTYYSFSIEECEDDEEWNEYSVRNLWRRPKFYNREDLKAKDVVRLIGIWEGEAGESFY